MTELHSFVGELRRTIEQASLEYFLAEMFGDLVPSVNYGQFQSIPSHLGTPARFRTVPLRFERQGNKSH